MKILFVNMFYYPTMNGGTEHSLKLLAEELASRGHKVAVATYDGKQPVLSQECISGVYVYRMYNPIFMKKAFHRPVRTDEKLKYYVGKYFNKAMEKQLEYILGQVQPDIVHTQNFFPTRLLKSIKRRGISTIHTLRDYFLLDPKSDLNASHRIIVNLHRLYQRFYTDRYLDMVTAPSELIMKRHTDRNFFSICRRKVIYNAVRLDMEETVRYIDEKKSRTEKTVHFLYVGSLLKLKGIDLLLRTFQEIKMDHIRLTICGSGPMQHEVEDMCRQDTRIRFKGQLMSSELAVEYAAADVVIVPSLWEEPFGRVVIEAAQHGNPIIGSNRGGVAEVIGHTKFGTLFTYDDPEDLKKQIKLFAERNYLRQFYPRLAEGIQEFSSEKQVLKFEEAYSDIRG